MAARTPRKTFARSFVVTLAIPACYTTAPPPPPQPPPPVVTEQQPPPRPNEQTVVTNPPRPTQGSAETPPPAPSAPPTYNFDQRWTVVKNGETCTAMQNVECPKPTTPGGPMPTCNPPPPMKIACPGAEAGWDGTSPLTIVQYANQSECRVEPPPVRCPPKVACNPPPPRKVACPTYQ